MHIITQLLVGLVLLIHVYIVILEMFLWTKKQGKVAFGHKSKSFADETKVLAANQGLYNAFLVAGFIWGLINQDNNIALFFFGCVCIAGLYGAYSTKKLKILYIQTIPALLGILSIFI